MIPLLILSGLNLTLGIFWYLWNRRRLPLPVWISLCIASSFLPELFQMPYLLENALPGSVVNLPLARVCAGLAFMVGSLVPWGDWGRRESLQRQKNDLSLSYRLTFKGHRAVSTLMVRLGVLSIAVGIAVMEVALSVVYGFQGEIQQKVIGFGAHVRIGHLLEEQESKVLPIAASEPFFRELKADSRVKAIAPYVANPAMLKSAKAKEQDGVILRGIDPAYPADFLKNALIEGTMPQLDSAEPSKDILISKKLAQRINIELGQKVFAYFFENELKFRDFRVCGIYETGLEEFDVARTFCDIRVLRRLRNWEADEAEAYEVWLQDGILVKDIPAVSADLEALLPYDFQATPITTQYAELFEWVELQHQNVWAILVIMAAVAVINMISVVLVLILEQTRTIGLLKAMGMSTGRVAGLFIANAFFLILMGAAIGNLLGMGLLFSQDMWGWLKVDQTNYFVNIVPVSWEWGAFFWVNMGVVAVCTLFMYLPALMIARIQPAKALRFD